MLPAGAVACVKQRISAICLDVLCTFFFFFAFAFPPQGDFAVVGHVEEKNDRQVDPPHKSTLILIHVNATAYWSLFMCNLKDKSRFVAFIIKMSVGFKGRQLNVQKPKMKATLIMPNNAVFIFLASSPPPAPSALLRHRLHFKSSKQF